MAMRGYLKELFPQTNDYEVFQALKSGDGFVLKKDDPNIYWVKMKEQAKKIDTKDLVPGPNKAQQIMKDKIDAENRNKLLSNQVWERIRDGRTG
jgi:hypothetical protein